LTVDALNVSDRDAFVETVGGVFEQSPWVAARAWSRRPFASVDDLHRAMVAEVELASRDEQVGLLRAHPDLGARAHMSVASTSEQAGAGLTALGPADFARLQALNTAYREKFEFPFLFVVKGSTVPDILTALETRLSRGADEEFAEALGQVYRIARFRLHDVVAP
jgi:2-oxo-4-hydroxy-4-carboxy-5-ureidoimidazoline decarboxylase